MDETIINALFDYFDNCPLMSGSRLNIDYLPEDTGEAGIEYAIATSPTDEIVKPYLRGGAQCQYPFIISSVNDYGPDEAQSIANVGFMEKLAKWMRQQCRMRKLPKLPEGMQVTRIRALGSGFLFEPGAASGKYQIQCMLEYYRKGDF
ncbi:hypothetical protein LJC74_03120 [Eubacteriales bacterium OttesenSCG-928-A19]|nr:hypothetical protein [Eubacteriales bacterium OttesenSCG-928-A19]